jgi:anaerobic selenocysteine-containing dehydrogenase
MTCKKSIYYLHSGGRQIKSLRKGHPDPLVLIHPETAARIGVENDDWVYIETQYGRIKQKATVSNKADPRVVCVDFGWWYPEKGISDMFGWAESNLNILTADHPPDSPETGSGNFRGILCKVYKKKEHRTFNIQH